MTELLLLLVVVLLVLTVIGRWLRKKPGGNYWGKKNGQSDSLSQQPERTDCRKDDGNSECGVSCFCDDRWLKRLDSGEEDWYYNDEELDCFKGRSGDDYNDAETEIFAEVLHTLKPNEVKDWLHCISLRGIELPYELKDEAILLMEQKNEEI